MSERLRRSWAQRSILAMNGVLIALALLTVALLNYSYSQAASVNRVALQRSLTPAPEAAEAGDRILNILLVGSDSSAGLDPDDPIQIGRKGERLADVIIIAHLDERTRDIALLSIPRDLWVPIAGTATTQKINAAFETGGPATLIETIEGRFGLPIHHYVNVDFASFQQLVDAVGTVEVYFPTPARDWDVSATPEPRSRTGFSVETPGCHALDATQALAYVRSRTYQTLDQDGEWRTDPTADLGRIRRQQAFLRDLMEKAVDEGARNPLVFRALVESALDNVVVDHQLNGQLLVDLGRVYQAYDPDRVQTYSLPVVDETVGTSQVLLPLDTHLEPLLALFDGARFDHPSTVRVSVVSAKGAPEGGRTLSAVTSALEAAGYEISTAQREGVIPGISIEHGPDGAAAGGLVAASLTQALGSSQPAPQLVPAPALPGRTVRIVVGEAPAKTSAAPSTRPGPSTRPAPSGAVVTTPPLHEGRMTQVGPKEVPRGSVTARQNSGVAEDAGRKSSSSGPIVSAGCD